MYDFYLYDLNLYLDTHPNDKKALAKFNEVNAKRKSAYELYISKYGPITAVQNTSEEHFDWINDPWPWERGVN
jgi:spore coat protein JB